MKSHISIMKTLDEFNKILESIASSMSEAFRVCDLEMAPYYETATEFCDIDGVHPFLCYLYRGVLDI